MNPVPKWPMLVYFICVAFTFTASTLFHIFGPHSGPAYEFLIRLDFTSVIILLLGIFYPLFTYASHCYGIFSTIYLPILTIVSSVVFYVLLFVKEENPERSTYIMFVLGVSYLVPMVHLAILENWFDNLGDPLKFSEVSSKFWLAVLVITLGLLIKLTKFPECFFPGKFDLSCHSHVLWHLSVIIAVGLSYYVNWEFYYLRRAALCPAV